MEILLDQTAYSIFENETIVTVTLRLSNTYREDIAVNVAVGELAGGYAYAMERWMCCIVFMQLHVYPIVQVLMHFSKHKVITSD